jgi:peptide/nickel transport system substrate-binding protein
MSDAYLRWLLTQRGVSRREFMARAAAVGVTSAMASALFTQSARAQTPKKGGTLIIGVDGGSSSDSLDPGTYSSSYMQVVGHQFGNCLVEIDSKGQAIPELAESWEAKPGATEWVFKLRKGVTFHNGKEMTAKDVVYSLNHHRGEGSKSGAAGVMKPITDIKETGPHEITVTLNSGNADLPYVMGDFHLLIIPEGTPFDAGLGTGPFVRESFDPGSRTVMKRNPNYWKSGHGHVDVVETLAINDMTARTSALQSGSIHIMNRVDPKLVETLKKNAQIQIFEIAGGGHYTFPMRCDTAPFDNNDLRLALKYAINREDLVKRILRGHGRVGNDHPVPSYDRFYAADIPQRAYDPDKAAFHYKKSGHSGDIELTVAENAFVGAVDAAQIFQQHAAKAGIPLKVQRVSSDGYWTDVWMKAPFCASYWNGRSTADLMLSVAYQSDAPWNDTFWKRPDFDKLLTAARAELDDAKRRQMYHDLQQMIVEDGGVIIPMFNNFIDAGHASVKGFTPSPAFEMGGLRMAEQVWLESSS